MSKFDGTTWTTYNTSNGLVNDYVRSIAIDTQGNKWFGTENGTSKFDGTTWTSYTDTNGLVSNIVNSIAIDQQGNKWFGTWGGGISKFDGTTWTTYNTLNGLVHNSVYSITIDSLGNKWFGTNGGISEFIENNNNSINEQFLNKIIISIFPNPASDMVSLNIGSDSYQNGISEDFEINIYNLMGKLVKKVILKKNQKQINIGNLSNGVYMLTIKSKSLTATKKLIIQK